MRARQNMGVKNVQIKTSLDKTKNSSHKFAKSLKTHYLNFLSKVLNLFPPYT